MGGRIPVIEPWTPRRRVVAVLAVLLSLPVGFVLAVYGSLDWCVQVGVALRDGHLVALDRAAVTRALLIEHVGSGLWAVPWLALAVLRRHHRWEALVYLVIGSLLVAWNIYFFVAYYSDPVMGEEMRCWHF